MGVIKEYPKKVNPFDKIESSEWNKIINALIDLDNYIQNDLEQFKQQLKNEIKNEIYDYLNSDYWNKIESYVNQKINEKINFVFDYGKVLNIPTSSQGHRTYNVSFNKTFPRIPIILLTPENMHPDVTIKQLWASNVTTTGFILNVFVTTAVSNTNLNAIWFAFSYV